MVDEREQWQTRPLGELVVFQSGNTPSTSDDALWNGHIPWVTAKDMEEFYVDDSEDRLSPAGAAAAARIASIGTTLMLTRGMTLHRRVPICRLRAAAAFNQDVKAVVPREGVDEAFLPYLLLGNHASLHALVESAGHGTGKLPTDILKGFEVLVPPPDRQKLLGRFFADFDDRIALLRDTNHTLENMARMLFRAWFVDFEPVRAKMAGRPPTSCNATTAALFPDRLVESELGEIPEGWQLATLGDHLQATKGLSYKGEGLADSGTPLHNLNSVYEGGGYKHEGLKWYRGDFKERHVCRPGDIIVANTEQGHEYRLIGFPALLPKRYGASGIFTHHIFRVVARDDSYLPHPFIYRLLLHPACREQVIGHTNGTTVNSLAREGLERPRFVLPPEKLVKPFNEIVSSITQRQEEGLDRIDSLARARDDLLPRLISGTMRIEALGAAC